jgi:hypothetical protein
VIYFIQAEGVRLIKIGFCDSLIRERIGALRICSPVPLKCIGLMEGGKPEERDLHHRFRQVRSHGEWFWPSKELLDFVRVNAKPADEQDLRPGRRRRRSPVKTVLYCPEGFSRLLLELTSRAGTSVAGLIDLAAREWALREQCGPPPLLTSEALSTRIRNDNRDRTTITVVGTPEWRQWFNEVSDSIGIDVNKFMRMVVIDYAGRTKLPR